MEPKALDKTLFSLKIAWFRDLGLLVFIVILSFVVQTRNPSFLTAENLNDLLINTAILSILAAGMMLVIVTRGLDLSIGATMALSGMISAMTINAYPGLPPALVIIVGVLVGLGAGAIIGFLVSKAGLLPIIASLGMMNVFRGLTFMVSGGKWVSAYQMPPSFKGIATGSILGINKLVVTAIVIYVVFFYFINHSRTGRQIYAVGSNPAAAKISGINMGKVLFLVYTLMGSLAGLAGVLWVSKFASAQSDTGMGYEMNVIAACVLGGVSISGGSGKVSGIIQGSLLLGILNNALPLINVSPFWQQAIQGVIILVAVIINVLVKRGVDRNNLLRRNS